jgi:hypothetical protein
MSGRLTKRDKARLIRALEKQGARVTPTRNGWIVRTDDGTMGTHRSESHGNDQDALRRDVRRIGLVWPFDKEGVTS